MRVLAQRDYRKCMCKVHNLYKEELHLHEERQQKKSNHPPTTHLLQAISSSVVPTLTHIINTSLHTGTFPTVIKQARKTFRNCLRNTL